MPKSPFESSDAGRHARELQHAESVTFDGPFRLERGGELASVTVAYETYGRLSPNRDNGVLVCHALSGDSHVAQHDDDDDPGWWDIVVGPGKSIDTDEFFVICPNVLGGCRGTTGPNCVNPKTGQPYGPEFPLVTIGDVIELQKRLVDHLGIERLVAVVGGSLGGQMVLSWATRYPDRMSGAIALATSARLTSQALAFDVVGRNAILCDPDYHAGRFYGHGHGPQVGLAIARMLGHITYLSREAMTEKFDAKRLKPRDFATQFETRFAVGSYLAHQGDRFVERFDANSYLTLSMAMDLFDLGDTPRELAESLARSRCRWLLVSYTSDWLFPPFQSQELVDALVACNKSVSYANVKSVCGHDAFLLPDELATYGELIRSFLSSVSGRPRPTCGACGKMGTTCRETIAENPTSIFHGQRRLDYDSIVERIPPGASVLDLGCGNGGLLDRLRSRGHSRLMGIELDEQAMLASVCRGFDVVQADLNEGLSSFTNKQFDVVVLSQTLQTVMDVERILREMLRVGRLGIVSFPNLGYHKLRSQLAEEGRSPRTDPTQTYQWYDTPNVRFLTLADFEAFCREKGLHVEQTVALDTEAGRRVDDNPNLNADLAIVVLSE